MKPNEIHEGRVYVTCGLSSERVVPVRVLCAQRKWNKHGERLYRTKAVGTGATASVAAHRLVREATQAEVRDARLARLALDEGNKET